MRKLLSPAAVLLSGICWFLAFDMSGNFGWLMWIAPIPVLYVSLKVSPGRAFLLSFLAMLIGRLSWWTYLTSILPLPVTVIATLYFPLIFALIVLAFRKIVRNTSSLTGAFTFPVLWCAFEFLVFLTTRDGTFGSFAYTQVNYLPVIQVASLTGILGISFLLCLIPAVVAIAVYDHRQQKKTGYLLPVTAVLLILAIGYSVIRLNSRSTRPAINVGLTALDEHVFHGVPIRNNVYAPNTAGALYIADQYILEISRLAKQGAQVIVMPEKVIPVDDSSDSAVNQAFMNAARSLGVTIVAGYTYAYKDNHLDNLSRVFSPDGKLIADYSKVNLFIGEVLDGFTPGKTPAFFDLGSVHSGTAICKDLDFNKFMRKYGEAHIGILYAPAWDFVRDGWLHCRMGIMRGVENGYSIVRNARQGRLTISDAYGRVLKEASSEDRKTTDLIGSVQPGEGDTLYSRWGDWFGYLVLLAAVFYLFSAFRRYPAPYSASKASTN